MLEPNFLGGVVEGFYGRPWTHAQRLDLINRLAALGLNTYFYAPKNDLKHRAIWRQLYDEPELLLFRELIQSCQQHVVNFIYGLSPGLDIRFSDQEDRNYIKSRFDQLLNAGVRNFALLFDDLPGQISGEDRAAFPTLAAAQGDVTNAIYGWLQERSSGGRFLFCPTPYCDRMDRVQLGGGLYLEEVGRLLNPRIEVLWTGPEIVSQDIPVDSIRRLTERIRRPPVIWDNLFANDYDMRRFYCGPYSGRTHELQGAVRGIVINPNNEYAINFIPLHTLAAFLNGDGEWKPREAFLRAVSEWLPQFETIDRPIALDDLNLLADCFYLPHEEGPLAETLLALVDTLLVEPVDQWGDAYNTFFSINARIQALFERLTELRDRQLFDAWSRRVWALKEELLVIDAALSQKRAGRDLAVGIELESCLPGTFRGGILARLERMLSIDGKGRVRTTSSPG